MGRVGGGHGVLARIAVPLVVFYWGAAGATPRCRGGPARLQRVAYDLELQIDRDRRRFSGRERIHVRGMGGNPASVDFRLNGIKVPSVTSDGNGALETLTANDHLEIRLPSPLRLGRQTSIVIEYVPTELFDAWAYGPQG